MLMNKQHGRWVEMQFSDKPPTKKINPGHKYVLFKVTDNSGAVMYDWGMSEWDGKQWGSPETPEGYSVEVVWWSEPLDPKILLAVPSKIIGLN